MTSTEGLFDFDVRLGIYMGVQAGCLSAAAVLILLSYALIRWWKRRGQRNTESDASGSSLFLNLMLADLLQAIGVMPSIRWMLDGRISPGSLCTAQAVIKQIGINGVAFSSLAIAFHTFGVLMGFRWKAPRHASKFAVLLIWAITALVVGIPYAVNRSEEYYGPTTHWCWIVDGQGVARIMSEYLWVWASALIMAILYGIMFLVMRGFLLFEDGKVSWANTGRVKPDLASGYDDDEREAREMANLLLFYPAVYIVCVFPNSLSRWLTFSDKDVPDSFTLFASALFSFSGLFNVILYFSTRKEYAVGPSTVPTITTTLPPTLPYHNKDHSSPSEKEDPSNPYAGELEASYGRQDQGQYHHRIGEVLGGETLYQSPPSRMISLTASSEIHSGGTATGPLAPRHSERNATTGSTSRVRPTGPATDLYKLDDDDDYGRLPN